MSKFVDLSTPQEQATSLLQSLKKVKGIHLDEQLQLEQESGIPQIKEFLTQLVSGNHNLFTSELQEKDVENYFNLICSLLGKLDTVTVDELVKKLMKLITSVDNDRSLLRLKILNNLYHLFDSDSISRYEVLICILQYALDSHNTEVVVPHLGALDSWIEKWRIDLIQTRKLYHLAYTILLEAKKSVQAYGFLIKYLHTFDQADEETRASAKQDAVKAASQAIKQPEITQCDDLLEMPVIQQLEHDPLHVKLYQLLRLFVSEKLEDFTSFHQKNPDYLESLGISHEECLKKIRLLSLASLAVEHQQLPYSLIAQTLNIDEEDVEQWIILAISANLLDAKINQLKRIVLINRSTQRVFTEVQWKQLNERIGTWKENVRSLLHIVRANQASISQAKLQGAHSNILA